MKQISYNIDEIEKTATQIWNEYSSKKIWAFQATMGAGKTTFIHALCNVINVTSAVGSPTFAIINEYKSPVANIIYHMDWYRLKDEDEAMQAGCEDCINSGNYCFIEWSEKFPKLLPNDALHLSLHIINNNQRVLAITESNSV